MTNIQILKRLFKEYTKKYIFQIFLAFIFTLILAASTSSIAWLLDPAVEKLFIQKNQSLMILIPLGIVVAFQHIGLQETFLFLSIICVGLCVSAIPAYLAYRRGITKGFLSV